MSLFYTGLVKKLSLDTKKVLTMRILLFTLILITASAQLVLATSQSLISLLIALLTELSALIGALITYTVIRRSHNN